MTDLQNELDQIFSLLSSIPVKGSSVEIMAAVRQRLRNAYQLASPDKAVDNG